MEELGQPGEHHLSSCTSSKGLAPPLHCESFDGPPGHRDKLGTSLYPDNICVACLVGQAEIEKAPAAKEAINKRVGIDSDQSTSGMKRIHASGMTFELRLDVGGILCTLDICSVFA